MLGCVYNIFFLGIVQLLADRTDNLRRIQLVIVDDIINSLKPDDNFGSNYKIAAWTGLFSDTYNNILGLFTQVSQRDEVENVVDDEEIIAAVEKVNHEEVEKTEDDASNGEENNDNKSDDNADDDDVENNEKLASMFLFNVQLWLDFYERPTCGKLSFR